MSTKYLNSPQLTEIDFLPDVIRKACISFKKDILKHSNEMTDLKLIDSLNSGVFECLSTFPIEKLFISLSNNDSIFYRFILNNNSLEFKFEVFFDEEKTEEFELQSILHIYENSIKKGSFYGSLEEMYNVIIATYASSQPTKTYFEYLWKVPNAYFKQYGSELALSYVPNPEKSLQPAWNWDK